MTTSADANKWADADKGSVHKRVLDYVSGVEQDQSEMFDRFVKLAALYDPNSDPAGDRSADKIGVIAENVVASNVDTVCAAIAATDVLARFQTDGGDWATQRRAKHLEWYAEQLGAELDIGAHCRAAFKGAPVKGTGIVKVYVDAFDRIRVEAVPVDDIVVPERQVRNGCARELHQRTNNVVPEDLIAEYPECEAEIRRAASNGPKNRQWAGYRPVEPNMVVVVESWKLPIGVKGKKGYKPGRHTKVVDGCDLMDEKWEDPHFPMAKIVWSEKLEGWYGISGAERIAGHQRVLNKSNWQIDRLVDQNAVPTQFVRYVDAKLAVTATNRVGSIVPYKGELPKTIIPPAVSPEVYQRNEKAKQGAFEEFGVSRMAAQSYKPSGLDSGAALREYRDQTTQRFALQEKAFERLWLDVVFLVIWCAKKLGKNAPTVMRHTRFGVQKLRWSDVDMRTVRVQIAAASTMNRTPAGRIQSVIEYAQAGIITQDEARELLQHPDLERALSLYTAALDSVEQCLDQIADGKIVMPEPFMNLKMCVWRGQMEYLQWREDGAPEEVLEALRQFVVQAAWLIAKQSAGMPQNANMPAGAGVDPNAMPPLPDAPPTGPAPTAAFAPQAMQLRATAAGG